MADKVESSLRKLATDVGEMRSDLRSTSKRMDSLEASVAALVEAVSNLHTDVGDLKRLHGASADAMTKAIKQLALDKSLEVRVSRLEGAVFGTKH